MDLDSDLDSKLSTGWVGFQICEILWIWIRFWIQFCPWVGSDYGFVFLLGFGFGFGFIFFLKSESESVNPNPTTSTWEQGSVDITIQLMRSTKKGELEKLLT